ncbi:MAG TPA: GW dipeptide domain-containing protein [Ignavibacteria bacterium]|nr:GW dipeptide domain-containing protein [Ignavibacteria bacterium]HMR39509.1 GW dipeptide domain-containing protein [Ignavibacteria bacterium]
MKKIMIVLLMLQSFNLISCGNKEDPEEITIQKSDRSNESDKSNESDEIVDSELNKTNADKTGTDNENLDGHSQGNYNPKKVIASEEVKNHIGDYLTIRGYVADVHVSEKVSYLNFENKFPKSIFSCVIFSSKAEAFGDPSKYKGKDVEVTGMITTYKNKPQVILNSPDQIKILK